MDGLSWKPYWNGWFGGTTILGNPHMSFDLRSQSPMVPNLLDSEEKPPRAAPKPFGTFFHSLYGFSKNMLVTLIKQHININMYTYAICSLHTHIYIHQTTNPCGKKPTWFFGGIFFPGILRILLANFQVFSLVGRDYKPQLSKLNGLDGFYWAAPISVAWLFEGIKGPWIVQVLEFRIKWWTDQWVKRNRKQMYSEFISRWNNPFTYKPLLDFWDIRGTPSGCQVSWLWRKHLYIDVSGFRHDFFFCGSPGWTPTLAFEKKATQYKKNNVSPPKIPQPTVKPIGC